MADRPQSDPPRKGRRGRKSHIDWLNEDPTLGQAIEPIWERVQKKDKPTLVRVATDLQATGHPRLQDKQTAQWASDWLKDYGAWRRGRAAGTSGVPATPRANGSWRWPTRTAAGCCWVCGADLKT